MASMDVPVRVDMHGGPDLTLWQLHSAIGAAEEATRKLMSLVNDGGPRRFAMGPEEYAGIVPASPRAIAMWREALMHRRGEESLAWGKAVVLLLALILPAGQP